ncbi:hypothetical protein G6F43_012620 [Rhizopus delemar]|nr:hypothetical protein G6F43_012620 [Rhizopus delemar]
MLPNELSLSDDQHNSLNITATIFMDNHQDQDSTEVGIKRNHDETLLPDTVSFEPPQGDRLTVRDFDVSEALYQMQLSLKKYKYKLSLEDHLHVIMASASILLLTPYKYPDELKPFIQHDNWLATIKLIQNRYKINRLSMPVNTVANMLATIDQLITGNINRKGAVHAIDSLSLSAHESMFAAALCSLIRKLPPLAIEEDMNESELCSRFVDPFLSGLFDNPDAGVYLRWTNETTLETKKHGNQDGLRPDMCITKSYGVKWSSSCGYGEAKASKQAEDHHVVCYDLLKVAAFCKNALDKQKFDGILGIQIVGRTIIFYVLLLPATKLYTMLKLAEIKLPDSLQGLTSLVTELPNILGVLDAFDNLCIPAKDIKRAIDCQTSTEPMSLFNLILSSSKDRKRPCHLKLRHN